MNIPSGAGWDTSIFADRWFQYTMMMTGMKQRRKMKQATSA
jgi:hypothetical protein